MQDEVQNQGSVYKSGNGLLVCDTAGVAMVVKHTGVGVVVTVPYSINTFHAIVDNQLNFQSLPFHKCLLCSLGLSLLLCGLSYDGADLSFMIASPRMKYLHAPDEPECNNGW